MTFNETQQAKAKQQAESLMSMVKIHIEVGFTRKEAMQIVLAAMGRQPTFRMPRNTNTTNTDDV
ncbi:hypothetical protein SEA_BLUENGOLD_169 [Gordonia phage BlueNGold]|nr:hypothetical protein SEA_BLUENGOLD_169 [Gordonia phage BlueNGold]WBF03923.1 hypothetical protein SEA_MAREELIH_170 [Gordonia phage Mareelih]